MASEPWLLKPGLQSVYYRGFSHGGKGSMAEDRVPRGDDHRRLGGGTPHAAAAAVVRALRLRQRTAARDQRLRLPLRQRRTARTARADTAAAPGLGRDLLGTGRAPLAQLPSS